MNQPTPPVSANPSSSSVASIPSRTDDDKIAQLAGDTAHLSVNGKANGSATPAAEKPKKPKMTSRLTRMFSRTDGKDIDQAKTNVEHGSPDARHEMDGTKSPRPAAPNRIPSVEKKDKSREGSVDHASHSKRFEMHEDGTHDHYLKSTKRNEKLSDMLRDMLGGKKKDHDPEDKQLSLMSNWVDQLRSERDSLASDKKGGPNATANLVEKYGKCQEIVGRGAFGIVRISHKQDSSGHEMLYAVKEFRRRPQETSKKYQKRLTSEFCISSSLRHPNVIHTLDLLQDAKGDYCEVMEYCAGGDL